MLWHSCFLLKQVHCYRYDNYTIYIKLYLSFSAAGMINDSDSPELQAAIKLIQAAVKEVHLMCAMKVLWLLFQLSSLVFLTLLVRHVQKGLF